MLGGNLTSVGLASQTPAMAHTYMLFDFADEETAQQARHKLETWKQAFRLDKKLQYKLDRGEADETGVGATTEPEPEPAAKPVKDGKGAKSDKAAKSAKRAKSGAKASDSTASSGPVKLLVRLYFSGHEKKSEQRWLDRIPVEEPFKGASPTVVQEGGAGFDDALAALRSVGMIWARAFGLAKYPQWRGSVESRNRYGHGNLERACGRSKPAFRYTRACLNA